MSRIHIFKDSSPAALEERITITVNNKEVEKYLDLLHKTWPKTRVEEIKRYG